MAGLGKLPVYIPADGGVADSQPDFVRLYPGELYVAIVKVRVLMKRICLLRQLAERDS